MFSTRTSPLVADPVDVGAVDDTVPVVILPDDAVELDGLAGSRSEGDVSRIPIPARDLLMGTLTKRLAGVLVDVGGAERRNP